MSDTYSYFQTNWTVTTMTAGRSTTSSNMLFKVFPPNATCAYLPGKPWSFILHFCHSTCMRGIKLHGAIHVVCTTFVTQHQYYHTLLTTTLTWWLQNLAWTLTFATALEQS